MCWLHIPRPPVQLEPLARAITYAPNAIKVVASEALQCPTLLYNGYGAHRIEGIGDKHVPWIHNVRNTNLVTGIDDEDCMRTLRLFNEPEGKEVLAAHGVAKEVVEQLPLLGISSISNLLSSIKTARYFEMTSDDIIFTVATDSIDMYRSRVNELRQERGDYTTLQAELDFEKCIHGTSIEHTRELNYLQQKTVHNLKYFTWREQQQKDVEDLDMLWYDREIWHKLFSQPSHWDELIEQFNQRTGLLEKL